MIHVANPIYDVVFKYLMEDERVAKILLGALIKKEILEVQVRRNEYSNLHKDDISIYRIDFAAKVREEDGSEHLLLIELQKTWLETETLRFRQYLAAQYANPENLRKDVKDGSAYPIITIYLLGHKVGDIDVPVLYINRTFTDYDGNAVTKGIPNPFIDSLTHDSIVVQIPYLKGHRGNRLERILNIFDQSRKEGANQQILAVEEEIMEDEEVKLILYRLLTAASDTEVRRKMNIEEEILSALENRDTQIMVAKEELKKQREVVKKQGEELKKQGEELKKQGEELKQKNKDLRQKDEDLKHKNEQLSLSVKLLHQSGLPTDVIASNLHVSVTEIEAILAND